ncbi:IS110 family transposase [Paracoccus siganidrum]|uniref:IS110 family transposase n=1 Tax=Paracoccus siganidrum TaxID=1276757 RepID=A0A419A3B0_9RHOB|nr:IS110 family transposase [Paracoccus siganidrum]RJL07703.1 IS110 family transposase [Paracoccus siganidrum]RMC28389.1 IS110 family transposase [Paracoccus siganidrum]
MQDSTFIGLDVHKATISVAVAQGERGGEVRHWGTVPHRPDHVRKLVEKLSASGARLHLCYEAGPCGYGLYRQLVEMGHDCIVVAPSLIPMKTGDRVKTDRRDAVMLAKLHRAGELTAVWVPDAAHEAMRDLVRARATAMRVTGKARQHLQGFLLRHGRIYPGKKGWTGAYRRWLAMVRFMHPAQQIVLQDYIDAVADAEARVERLTGQIADLLPTWSLAPVVDAVQAMRGVGFIVAVTVVAEVGDFQRFDNPRQLMAYLGLTPSEHSSGASVRRGGITKAGSGLARRALIEGAWSYRMQARVSPKLHARLEALPKSARDIAWKGQLRMCQRYRHLVAAGKAKVVVVTAIAREMVGFLWAIAKAVAVPPGNTEVREG